jgi:sensor histidine kinase YesM
MNSKWYANKSLVAILHVTSWLLLFTLPYFLRPSFDSPRELIEQNKEPLNYIMLISRIIWVGLFYFNANIILPRTVYKKRFWTYVAAVLAIFCVLFLIDWGLFQILITGLSYNIKNFFSFNFFPILFIIACSTAYKMVNDRVKEDRLQKEKENENLKTELSLLRSQVSPHFMFNIMNNMVALARKKSDLLEPSLIKLSSLLRYMLYETDDKVPLQKEVEYLQSYIDLQKQRFGSNLTIKASLNKVEDYYEIEPMLLIPFVENAFKHGTGLIENAEIDVELRTEKNMLSFLVRNKFNEASDEIKDKSSGIGLPNVQRRLDLLYGNKHSLLITKQDNWFIVSLQIVLH